MIVAGLDLAASPRRCSGYSRLNSDLRAVEEVTCLYSDSDIISAVERGGVKLLAIDAPIAEEPVFRDVDRVARSLGYNVIPPTLGPMRALTRRAWTLYVKLKAAGVEVIETHPSSALKSSRCPSVEELLASLGVALRVDLNNLREDEVDAIISSLVAYCYHTGRCIEEVRGSDGIIYLISRTCS